MTHQTNGRAAGPLADDADAIQAVIRRQQELARSRPKAREPEPRPSWDDEPEDLRVGADLSGWTKIPNALPLVLLSHGVGAREQAVLLVVMSVAGWGYPSKRWATIGCRSISARLGGVISSRTALRALRRLADGYRNRHGTRVEGHRLIRFKAGGRQRKRMVIDLQPVMDELAAVWPDGDAPMRGRGHPRP